MDANLSMKHQLEEEALQGNLGEQKEEIMRLYENHRWLNIVGCYWYYYNHKKAFSPSEQQQIEAKFASMLTTVEKPLIRPSLKYKFGYYPFRSYSTFASVENLYFKLRNLLKIKKSEK